MSMNSLSFYPSVVFYTIHNYHNYFENARDRTHRINFYPFLTLTLIYDYHITVGKDQTLYFILSFCLLGDMIVMSDNFYYFISVLMAYWGASILF